MTERASVPGESTDPVDATAVDANPVAAEAALDRSPRLAWRTFVVLGALSAVFYAVEGRGQWFFQDEWTFLAARDGGSLDGLLAPHNNEHWTTIPIVAYRLLWNVVGLHSYRPYQAMAIGMHLATAVLLRAVMRREGTSAWMATAVAGAFLFLGSGAENVIWAFQVTFTGALALGLAHLLLADHPSPSPRRVVAGIGCGIAALMFSGLGLVMAGVVGLALLLRRGWWAAARSTVPVVAVYGAWRASYGEEAADRPGTTVGGLLGFVATGVGRALSALSGWPIAAGALIALVGAGLLVAAREADSWADRRRRLATPLALVAGTLVFFAGNALSRAGTFGSEYATRSRFTYVAIALLAPVVAVGADAVVRRWRAATIPALVIVLIGVPVNLGQVEARAAPEYPPAVVLAVAGSPTLDAAPAEVGPFTGRDGIRAVTNGWLREAAAEGRIPSHDPSPAAEVIAAALLLVRGPAWTDLSECTPLEGVASVDVGPSDSLGFVGSTQIRLATPGGELTPARSFGAFAPTSLLLPGIALTVELTPDPNPLPEQVCIHRG